MKAYKRNDFIKLPAYTIYSRLSQGDFFSGLYCKTSDSTEYGNDWVEQNLISEMEFPEGVTDGGDASCIHETWIDNFIEFRTDLDCGGRDGMFDDEDILIVWDNRDIIKLIDYLQNCIK